MSSQETQTWTSSLRGLDSIGVLVVIAATIVAGVLIINQPKNSTDGKNDEPRTAVESNEASVEEPRRMQTHHVDGAVQLASYVDDAEDLDSTGTQVQVYLGELDDLTNQGAKRLNGTDKKLETLNGAILQEGLTFESKNIIGQQGAGFVSFFDGNSKLIGPIDCSRIAGKDLIYVPTEGEMGELVDRGVLELRAVWSRDGVARRTTEPVDIKVDTIGPRLISTQFQESVAVATSDSAPPAGDDTDKAPAQIIYLEFDTDDFNETDLAAKACDAFRIYKSNETIATISSIDTVEVLPRIILDKKKNVVKLTLKELLKPGIYRIVVLADPNLVSDTCKLLTDSSGNLAGGDHELGRPQEGVFAINPAPGEAEIIEYPEFQPTLPQPDTIRRPNAGDKVITEVVRLFYFRDAHRMAQIVNRSVQSTNEVAVSLAEQRAEGARREADEATDDRRAFERQAVLDAQELRRIENQLADDREQLDALLRRDNDIKVERERISFEQNQITSQLENPPSSEEQEKLENRQNELTIRDNELGREETLVGTSKTSIEASIQALESSVTDQRLKAQQSNERAITQQAVEDRARENQFRLEVASAHADPNTFAPGRLDSVDPVAQVSISVIGEGLIQLRGPRKGIDTIRTMIHQMDAPVGQVKVEIVTVQVNGEEADRMEAPLGKIEAHLGLGRFLTGQSLMLLRMAIQEEADQIAMQNDGHGHYQIDRDRKYLYSFFGRDFIDELYEMDSEFLHSENKLLSLHSMDIVNLHQALFILALAKNDVRQRVLVRFMEKVRSDLVQAEFDYRRAAEIFPHKTRSILPQRDRERIDARVLEGISLNNAQRYHFRNLLTFFGSLDCNTAYAGPDSMNPMQREFVKLAQIFKARLISELELKQRVIERTMIESNRLRSIEEEEQAEQAIRPQVLKLTEEAQRERLHASAQVAQSVAIGRGWIIKIHQEQQLQLGTLTRLNQLMIQINEVFGQLFTDESIDQTQARQHAAFLLQGMEEALATEENRAFVGSEFPGLMSTLRGQLDDPYFEFTQIGISAILSRLGADIEPRLRVAQENAASLANLSNKYEAFIAAADTRSFDFDRVSACYFDLVELFGSLPAESELENVRQSAETIHDASKSLNIAIRQLENARFFLAETRSTLEREKLLDFLIEEQEQRLIDLLDGTRSQVATIDGYLKRLAIALEDDFKLQFYDPSFVRIRDAATAWDVHLGQVERTSILTNNRALAKVTPQATMEFDLPKRSIAIVEALDGAKALAEDYGALLQDPTFLSAYQMMGGALGNGKVQSVLPGQSTSADEYQMGVTSPNQGSPGSALESLIPDPAIYKFETGTGYEIRPVIQPDGNSIVYDFNYMYTTEVREPVRADEKHLGRVRRHFIDTQVQTSSFEMRELSRYQVTLKAARTAKGVPLFEDIPGLGVLFRPLPSDESSIQQNIILARSVVYPTLYDLMGLRWAPSVVDLNHVGLRDAEHVVRGRNQAITHTVFDTTGSEVDDILGIPFGAPEHYRPDLYHQQTSPSPYHPYGYSYDGRGPDDDPTGRGFERYDRRPPEGDWRLPPYDSRFRNPIQYDESYPYQILEQDGRSNK